MLLLNAWLESSSHDDDEDEDEAVDDAMGEEGGEADENTMRYWAARLRPLWDRGERNGGGTDGRETTVIICNRCGTENGTCPLLMFLFEIWTLQGNKDPKDYTKYWCCCYYFWTVN